MDRLRRAALVTQLAERLIENGSWCGETHLQKATYVAQELLGVPTEFPFVLYMHGPFSFDLRDELTALRADGLLELRPQSPPYGPRIVPTPRSRAIRERFQRTVVEFDPRLDFAARRLGDKGVAGLERLATALYVTRRAGEHNSPEERARELTRLKPHISLESARAAVDQIDAMAREAEAALTAAGQTG